MKEDVDTNIQSNEDQNFQSMQNVETSDLGLHSGTDLCTPAASVHLMVARPESSDSSNNAKVNANENSQEGSKNVTEVVDDNRATNLTQKEDININLQIDKEHKLEMYNVTNNVDSSAITEPKPRTEHKNEFKDIITKQMTESTFDISAGNVCKSAMFNKCEVSGTIDINTTIKIECNSDSEGSTNRAQNNMENKLIASKIKPEILTDNGFKNSQISLDSKNNSETKTHKTDLTDNPRADQSNNGIENIQRTGSIQKQNEDNVSQSHINKYETIVETSSLVTGTSGLEEQNNHSLIIPVALRNDTKAQKVVESAATGVNKFLQLMNVLNKNPEKCKKWLQNQDLQRQKLGDKYKEPIIYSTVKQISLGQSEKSPTVRVNNSLDLLNALYLNPDKCTVWLKKQQDFKNEQGKNYKEPAIFSTVKLIALHHKHMYKSTEISKTEKDSTFRPLNNEDMNTTKKEQPNSEQISFSPTYIEDAKIKDNNKDIKGTSLPEKSQQGESRTKVNMDNKETSLPEKSQQGESTKKVKKKISKSFKRIIKRSNLIYVLFPNNVSFECIHQIIRRQKTLIATLGPKYRIPLYNYQNRKIGILSPVDRLTKIFVVRVPYAKEPNKVKFIKFAASRYDCNNIDWIVNKVNSVFYYREKFNGFIFNIEDEDDIKKQQLKEQKIKEYMELEHKIKACVLEESIEAEETMQKNNTDQTGTSSQIIHHYTPTQQPAQITNKGLDLKNSKGQTGSSSQIIDLYASTQQSAHANNTDLELKDCTDQTGTSSQIIHHYTPVYSEAPYFPPSEYTASGFFPTSFNPQMQMQPFYSTSNFYQDYNQAYYSDTNYVNSAYAMGYYPNPEISAFHPPPPGTDSLPLDPLVTQGNSTLINPSDSTNITRVNFLPESKQNYVSDKHDKSSVINVSMKNIENSNAKIVNSKKPVVENLIIKNCDSTKSSAHTELKNETTHVATKPKDTSFSVENCTDNIAFHFKGKEVYYPFFVKDLYSRQKWVSNQRQIYEKKGDMYTPPEFDKNGKLVTKRFERKISDDTLHASSLPVPESVGTKEQVTFDKFGMRINPTLSYQYEQENKKYTIEKPTTNEIVNTNSKNQAKLSVSEVFGTHSRGIIQPPPEKQKISVKLKKNKLSSKKDKKKAFESPQKIECPSIRLDHQRNMNVSRAKTTKATPAPKPTTGWPSSFFKSTLQEVKSPNQESQATISSPDVSESHRSLGKSKASAFERLGPPTDAKIPKLTVNLTEDKESKELTRKVVEHVPVYLREDILNSNDEIVKEYLSIWPWVRPVKIVRECSYNSRDPLLDEIEMIPCYSSKSAWIKVSVTGYPEHFKKEDVLDLLLSVVNNADFVPCFIEFKHGDCKFLINRSEHALTSLHTRGLIINKDGVEIKLAISQTALTLDNLKFYKGGVFKTKLQKCYDEEFKSLNLSAFQLQPDNSHFMYFPLSIESNQIFILNVIKATLPWRNITMLDLSSNRLKEVSSFNFEEYFPSLRILDLSNNLLTSVSKLACFKGIPMYSLSLDGNPLCGNFIQRDHYIDTVKLVFPRLLVLDGIKVDTQVDIKKNFSVSPDAVEIVNAFLEIFFTLTDSNDRTLMESLYNEKAVYSITCRPDMKRNPMYHNLREYYMWCRSLNDCINPVDPFEGTIVGNVKIARYFTKWPITSHVPQSFTVDIMHHTDMVTIFKVTGLFKIPSDNLIQEEPVTEFSRTFVLATEDGIEYKIMNDMMYISEASQERMSSAFQYAGFLNYVVNVDTNCLKLDISPDEEMKHKLAEILKQLTYLPMSSSRRCLDKMNWNLKKALEYFMNLEKVGALTSLEG